MSFAGGLSAGPCGADPRWRFLTRPRAICSTVRYLGITLGVLGAGAMLTPIIASIADNAGLTASGADDRAYLAAGLGLVVALVGLVVWSLSELSRDS